MFRASLRPSSEATTIAAAASGLPLERGGSSVIGRGRLRIGILIARFRSIIILLFRSIIRSIDHSLLMGTAVLFFFWRK